jgi:hypothetical protein
METNMIEQKMEIIPQKTFTKKTIDAMISKFSNFEDALEDDDWLKYVVEYNFFHTRLSLYNCYIECGNNKEKGLKLLNKRRKRFERIHH